eukprot:g224.t1
MRNLRRAAAILDARSVQYSLLSPERESGVAELTGPGVPLVAYSPLCLGLLAGRYQADGRKPESFLRSFLFSSLLSNAETQKLLSLLKEIGDCRSKTMAQVALNFALTEGQGCAIVGARNKQQVLEMLGVEAVEGGWAGFQVPKDGVFNRSSTQLAHTVQEAQLCDGETLTAIQQLPQLARTAKAFALWCAGGGALAWGAPDFGGRPSRAVQELLQEGPAVQEIRATEAAFCALLADGRVVTWGDAAFGGDSREAQELAAGRVRQIGANSRAFVGILADGRAVTAAWSKTN